MTSERFVAAWTRDFAYGVEFHHCFKCCRLRHSPSYISVASDLNLSLVISFAVEEAQLALIRLYQRFIFRLPAGIPESPPMRMGITCTFRDGLQVHVISRKEGRSVEGMRINGLLYRNHDVEAWGKRPHI